MARRHWTATELQLLRELYPHVPTADVAALLDRPVSCVYRAANGRGLSKTAEYLRSDLCGRLQRGVQHPAMMATRFQPGQSPWNRGRKGWKAGGRSALTRFKPGSVPHTWVPVGSYRIADGMLERKIGEQPGPNHLRWRPVARLVWEAAHGPVPQGHLVVFKPGRRTVVLEQITLDAVECISRAENARRNHPRNISPEMAKLTQLRGAITRQVNRITREAKAAAQSSTPQ